MLIELLRSAVQSTACKQTCWMLPSPTFLLLLPQGRNQAPLVPLPAPLRVLKQLHRGAQVMLAQLWEELWVGLLDWC